MAQASGLCSLTPSVLFTLQEIMNNGLRPADWVLLASFGAGLSAHALLLRSSLILQEINDFFPSKFQLT